MGIFLRVATIQDAEVVLEWRNDKASRENSFSKGIIDLDSHMKWYQRKLQDDNCYLYILMDNDERIGQVRIDLVNGIGEISYMIAPEKRGNGYGKAIISLCDSVKDVMGAKAYMGLVNNDNEASKKCFVNNGYAEFTGGDICCYVKVL